MIAIVTVLLVLVTFSVAILIPDCGLINVDSVHIARLNDANVLSQNHQSNRRSGDRDRDRIQ